MAFYFDHILQNMQKKRKLTKALTSIYLDQVTGQKKTVLELLLLNADNWVSFRKFFYKRVAEPGTRISELRKLGHNIINTTKYVK